ncbi:MAG: hypothetical protein BWY59_01955 [Verrucomicrobia bacterium ADurb.Bin345]|nr:MAG: hypothetical protein BWY59_01955 [Verrucomicrobia bacterium ADurb.Bin345]
MKLLLDQNLSHKLIAILESEYPGSRHVRDLQLSRADDDTVWDFAAKNGFAIVSKDADFLNRSLLKWHPPKVIQLCLGNCTTSRIREVLLKERDAIDDFFSRPEESVLILE